MQAIHGQAAKVHGSNTLKLLSLNTITCHHHKDHAEDDAADINTQGRRAKPTVLLRIRLKGEPPCELAETFRQTNSPPHPVAKSVL